MSRKRYVKSLKCFGYGEGSADKNWLKYLKKLYIDRGKGIVYIDGDSGGSPKSVIEEMSRQPSFDAYPKKVVVVDDDRGESEMMEAERYIKSNDLEVKIIVSECCLEYELLKISGCLDDNGLSKLKNKASSEIKKIYKEKCGGYSKEDFAKHFPKNKLDEARKTSPWLDGIIKNVFEL